MQRDTRLARLLHVLIHMDLRGGTTTSETIAQMLHTQPSLVRRTMAALRAAGYVESIVGPGEAGLSVVNSAISPCVTYMLQSHLRAHSRSVLRMTIRPARWSQQSTGSSTMH